MADQKLNLLVEKTVAKFWSEFEKHMGCQKLGGDEPEYICKFEGAMFKVWGNVYDGEYKILICVLDVVDGDWFAYIGVRYDEDGVISIKHHANLEGNSYRERLWESMAKFVRNVAAIAMSARSDAYREAKRQAPGGDLLGLFIEEFWKAFGEIARENGISRIEGGGSPKFYAGEFVIYGRRYKDLAFVVFIEPFDGANASERGAVVEVINYEETGEIDIKYEVVAEGVEQDMWELKVLAKLALIATRAAEIARKKTYQAAKRQLPQGSA